MRWFGYVSCRVEMRTAHYSLFRKGEGKRPLERSRCRWEDNIKILVLKKWGMTVDKIKVINGWWTLMNVEKAIDFLTEWLSSYQGDFHSMDLMKYWHSLNRRKHPYWIHIGICEPKDTCTSVSIRSHFKLCGQTFVGHSRLKVFRLTVHRNLYITHR
jgi:hypothetical protein